ncbi:MAG: hypothetical protein GF331_14370 [Chitinivibrionales bacterium]|nr:hypothetical protein [Chitinivibrionales bacterium]
MLNALQKDFVNPPASYRGKPFWAWNGKLEPDELRRQIRMMKRMGLGGFFMHSRVGLDTPYLADEWFECVGACIDEAAKHGMEAWLYDEDRWPSGAAGGLVTKNPKYRRRSLAMDIVERPKGDWWTADTVAAFVARIDGNRATDVHRIKKGGRIPVPGGYSLLRFRVVVDPCSAWHNGYTYLDTMNHEAVREFVKVTHESYRAHNADAFGKTVPGIFTDEPNYGNVLTRNRDALPWTGALPAVFKKRHGYTLTNHLPDLFFQVDGEQTAATRYHYMETITFLFVDAFSRQIGEWCAENGLQATGHMLAEQTLSSQASVVGATLRHYEYMQAPGMDLLTEYNREYDTAKQVSSVARQFGHQLRLTETYGCTGWDFPFEGHKALGDWQAALGINLRCQHLSWYTMRGQAKRDYPAGIFYQSPWWKLYPHVEDYFARVNAVTGRGDEVREVLVVHPIESMWLHVSRGWRDASETVALDRMIVTLRDTLLAANIDFDYGDEDIMGRHAKVRKAKDGARLVVGKAQYRVVVVPPMETIRSSTLALLGRFVKAGGTVVQAGKPPSLVDARPSALARELAATSVRAPARGADLVAAVERQGRVLSITGTDGAEIASTLSLVRRDKDAYYVFICNTGHDFRKQSSKITHDIPVRKRTESHPTVVVHGFGDCSGAPVELDPVTGERYVADARNSGGQWHIETSLPRLGSRLFVVPRTKERTKLAKRPKHKDTRRHTLRRQRWDIQLSEPNVLVLDRPHYAIGDHRFHGPEEILYVDMKVRDALGIPHRGGSMVQPWARERNENPKRIPVILRYDIEVRTLPSGDIMLALEEPQRYTVTLNGTQLDTDTECGWWCDRSLRTLRIDAALLRVGSNELVMECAYDENHPGFEIAYLLGPFGVRVKGASAAVTVAPTSLSLGDWVSQGLPFYAGSVGYVTRVSAKHKKGERLVVRVPEYRGVAVRVLVDGREAGVIGWEPNEVDITDYLSGTHATLCVEVIGHRRNSHGPLHQKTKHPAWTGPGNYVTKDWDWTDNYHLVPCGLMAPPVVVTRR